MSLADKYDSTRRWQEPCAACGEPVEMSAAWWEVIGPYHQGCFGYPVCCCDEPHEGNCLQQQPEGA